MLNKGQKLHTDSVRNKKQTIPKKKKKQALVQTPRLALPMDNPMLEQVDMP